ncbi:hypothetical protein M3Y98_00957000 [Aphelenchoides besseyi]|nr:hypothetical protein M3Y98_00957000 [Aphelenchoides besseyi]KAI6194631.1 hypothetical protein M3Y96_01145200 [Aphelenchoides besseyi]
MTDDCQAAEGLGDDQLMEEDGNQLISQEIQSSAMNNLIVGSILMFTLPGTLMYIFYKFVFEGVYHMPSDQAILYSGIVGVLCVYLIIAAFIYIAWREEKYIERRNEESKNK